MIKLDHAKMLRHYQAALGSLTESEELNPPEDRTEALLRSIAHSLTIIAMVHVVQQQPVLEEDFR